jgi:hypothetical protein
VILAQYRGSDFFGPILLFDRYHPSAPTCTRDMPTRAAAVKDGPSSGSLARSVLDGCEHDGTIERVGGLIRQGGRYSSGSMQVRTLSRKYSSFLRP